jgi:hypothetical protein
VKLKCYRIAWDLDCGKSVAVPALSRITELEPCKCTLPRENSGLLIFAVDFECYEIAMSSLNQSSSLVQINSGYSVLECGPLHELGNR